MSMKTATSDHEKLVAALRMAIEEDEGFFQAAKADPIFRPAREQVDALLVQLLSEAKEVAEGDLTTAQDALDEMDDWHADEEDSANCEKARAAMGRARDSFSTDSYDGYQGAASLAHSVWGHAIGAVANQEFAMRLGVDNLTKRFRSLRSVRWPLVVGKPHGWQRDRDAAYEHCERAIRLASVPGYEVYTQAESLLKRGVGRLDELKTLAEAAKRNAERQAEAAKRKADEGKRKADEGKRKAERQAAAAERKARRQREKRTELIKLHLAQLLLLVSVMLAVVNVWAILSIESVGMKVAWYFGTGSLSATAAFLAEAVWDTDSNTSLNRDARESPSRSMLKAMGIGIVVSWAGPFYFVASGWTITTSYVPGLNAINKRYPDV